MWLSLLKAVLSIAESVTSYLESKQMIDAGTAISLKENYKDALEKIDKAQRARSAVQHDADSVHDDPNNRD